MATIFVSTTIPLLVLATILWRGKWTVRDEQTRWFLLSCVVACIVSTVIYFIGTYAERYYSEVWYYKIISVRYYEDWDERVSCRHAVYRTEAYTTTDSKGRMVIRTRQVFSHYQHAYDVDYHPAHWEAVDEYKNEHSIDQKTFDIWCVNWHSKKFVELNRHYHRKDGNLYQGDWNGEFYSIYPWGETHSYENRVRSSDSAFGFAKVDEDIKNKFPRPSDQGIEIVHGYGIYVSNDDEWLYRRLDADFGPKYKIHNLVMLFDASKYDQKVVETLRNAWEGANKNELVTCIGLGTNNKIVWCDVFSWMDDTTIHGMIRQEVVATNAYSANATLGILQSNIPKYWKKKSFKDFEYLESSLPIGWVVVSYFSSLISGVSAYYIINRHFST